MARGEDALAMLASFEPLHLASSLGLKIGKRSHGGCVVLCPWHNERDPSCNIRIAQDGNVYAKCHACGSGGDPFELIAAVHGLSTRDNFPEILLIASDITGVAVGGAPVGATHRRQRTHEDKMRDATEAWLRGRPIPTWMTDDEVESWRTESARYIAESIVDELKERVALAREPRLPKLPALTNYMFLIAKRGRAETLSRAESEFMLTMEGGDDER